MTNNHSLSPAKAIAQLHQDEHLPAQNIPEMNECSYRSDYSLQEAQPADADYTSYRSKEELYTPATKDNLKKKLSYAERRLQKHL